MFDIAMIDMSEVGSATGAVMVYQEVQRFPLGFFIGVVAFIVAIGFIVSFRMTGQERIIGMVGAFVPAIIVGAFYLGVQLRTEVTRDELKVKFPLFQGASILKRDIRSVEIVEYSALGDFGGWGVRYGAKGKIYSARGNKAVKVEIQGAKPLLIGTQMPDELKTAITDSQ